MLSVDDVEGEGFWLTAQTLASINPRRVCEYMQTALESLVAALETAPSTSVRALEVLPAAERHRLAYEWNDTQAKFPRHQCIHQLFEEQVRTNPNATALVYEKASLTYAELNRRANRLAHYLRGLGVKPDARVAICVERNLEMVVALLAVLKAGGAYVPLDPAYPAERLRFMLEDCAPVALLTQGHLRGVFTGLRDTLSVIDLSADSASWRHQPDSNPDCASVGLTPQHLAYVIYTSGSTGNPKGVAIEHRNTVNLIYWGQSSFVGGVLERTLFSTSLSFDLAVYECFLPLSTGATVRIVHDALDIVRAQADVTLINTVPSAMNALVEAKGVPPTVRAINLAGEALKRSLVENIFSATAVDAVCNLYGPTETTTYSTWVRMRRGEAFAAHIGRPIANTKIYILDEYAQPVPVGVAGGIYIAGAGVARGYLNRPELTAERFLQDPFAAEAGARMYKTGDLGRWRADGTIEFLGRNDFQVKIRGFRIELGEIEARLAEHPGVREAVVVAREDVPGEKRLVAYYTPAENGQPAGAGEFRAHLSSKLPDYMVPAAYVRMDLMPLTANGKLNRKALPMPEGDVYAVRGYEAPQGEVETRLVGIWADLLKVRRVGRQDNFFELGGHSLLAMQLTARIRRMFEVELPVRSIFEAPTIAGLVLEVGKAQIMGLKARTPILQSRKHGTAAEASQEALLMQLEKLSAQEARNLLKTLLDEKQNYEFRS
jgi:amino acid adenylation domain-containing protein